MHMHYQKRLEMGVINYVGLYKVKTRLSFVCKAIFGLLVVMFHKISIVVCLNKVIMSNVLIGLWKFWETLSYSLSMKRRRILSLLLLSSNMLPTGASVSVWHGCEYITLTLTTSEGAAVFDFCSPSFTSLPSCLIRILLTLEPSKSNVVASQRDETGVKSLSVW